MHKLTTHNATSSLVIYQKVIKYWLVSNRLSLYWLVRKKKFVKIKAFWYLFFVQNKGDIKNIIYYTYIVIYQDRVFNICAIRIYCNHYTITIKFSIEKFQFVDLKNLKHIKIRPINSIIFKIGLLTHFRRKMSLKSNKPQTSLFPSHFSQTLHLCLTRSFRPNPSKSDQFRVSPTDSEHLLVFPTSFYALNLAFKVLQALNRGWRFHSSKWQKKVRFLSFFRVFIGLE